jgi:hypothetical protein
MITKLKFHFLFLAILSASTLAHAQGTAFTYQGRLNVNGSLANGDYDLKFSIFDDPTAGSQVGESLTNAPTSVSNGLFTVTLDFGGGVFTGDPRWLEIGVTTNGSGENFTPLSSRQALTASPYAIFAGTSANVASGSVVKSLNGLKDEVSLEAGANVTLTPNGNTLTIASAIGGGSNIWSVLNTNAFYNAGNVGIGTMAPATALEANGIVRSTRSGVAPQYIQLNGGDSGSIKLTAQSTVAAEKNLFIENLSAEATPGPNNNMQFVLGTAAARSTKMTITKDGALGIGTISPVTKLTVFASQHGIEHTDGTVRLATYVGGATGGGWLGTISPHQLNFFVNNGEPSQTIAANGFDVRFYTADLWLGHSSRRGSPGHALVDWVTPVTGVHQLVLNFGDDWAETVIGGSVTEVKTLRITGGADLAEPFETSDSEIPKGSVVVIDEEHAGRLKRSTSAYDTRVAGIVSGANGINPGIALHQQGAMEGGQNVALSGRVYVQADAAFGAIKPGDLLTTSDTPGHAMKVTDHAKSQGAILGKAMGSLNEGKGMVLVLVSLQ